MPAFSQTTPSQIELANLITLLTFRCRVNESRCRAWAYLTNTKKVADLKNHYSSIQQVSIVFEIASIAYINGS